MDLASLDTSKLLFDVNSETFVEDIERAIPSLTELDFGLPKDKIYQYVVLMCDIGSPMSRDVSDYYQKKYKCAEAVGFEKIDGKYDSAVTKALTGENKAVNGACAAYLAHLATPEYSQLVAFYIILSAETRKVFGGDIGSNSDQIIDRVTQRMKELSREVYGSGNYDEVAEARRALYEQVEKSANKMRPEDIAMVLAEGKELPKEFGPYDDGDYKPEVMEFLADDEEMAKRRLTEEELGNYL